MVTKIVSPYNSIILLIPSYLAVPDPYGYWHGSWKRFTLSLRLFVSAKRLWIRWFPRLCFRERCRNLEFTITIVHHDNDQGLPKGNSVYFDLFAFQSKIIIRVPDQAKHLLNSAVREAREWYQMQDLGLWRVKSHGNADDKIGKILGKGS